MFGIESRTVGIYNFDYFSIDMLESTYLFGGKEYTIGTACCAIANLPWETQEQLLRLGAALNTTRKKHVVRGCYSWELFEEIKENILNILKFIENIEPFSFFNIEYSTQIVIDMLSHEPFEKVLSILEQPKEERDSQVFEETYKIACKQYEMAYEMMRVYCYLINDAVNFATMIQNFTSNLMLDDSRTKENLAKRAYGFCRSEEVKQALEDCNFNKELDSVNLRPRVTQVPVILWNEEKEAPYLGRRLYFGRLMDFLVTEWFEGLMRGHYLWKCGVCGDYFLMTSARRQLYCGKFNPEYGTTCDHVANNRRLAQEKGLTPQKKEDSPIWQLWQKRQSSIRKNKSLGKYSKEVSTEAKRILDSCYEQAQIDPEYAKSQYESDITLSTLYEQAQKNIFNDT